MEGQRKLILFGTFSVIAGILFWTSLYKVLYLDRVGEITMGDFGLLLSSFLFWILATIFFFISAQEARMIFFNTLIISAVLLILFGLPHTGNYVSVSVLFGGTALFLLFMFLSWNTLRFERDDRLKIRFSAMVVRSLSLFFTSSFLIISLAYLFSPSLSGTLRDITIPRRVFDVSLIPIEIAVRGAVPFFSFHSDLEEFLFSLSILEALGGKDAAALPLSPEFLRRLGSETEDLGNLDLRRLLTDPQVNRIFKDEARRQAEKADQGTRERIREEYSERFGVKIGEGETIGDFIYAFLNAQLAGLTRVYQNQLPVAVAFGVFSTLKILSWPFKWVVVLISLGIFNILKRAEFFHIEEKDVKKETIVL